MINKNLGDYLIKEFELSKDNIEYLNSDLELYSSNESFNKTILEKAIFSYYKNKNVEPLIQKNGWIHLSNNAPPIKLYVEQGELGFWMIKCRKLK